MPRPVLSVVVATTAAIGIAACGSSKSATPGGSGGSSGAGPTVVNVALTSAGCSPDVNSVAAGATTFTITNKDADAVTEAELLSGTRILGEKENIAPGLDGSFSLNLDAGAYSLSCPGGSGPESIPFTVTGAAASPSAATGAAALKAATDGYRTYVQTQVASLKVTTDAFVVAVKAGDIAKAKALYAAARVPYERIEPVAESFGDLDPEIDARIGDVDDPSQWTGFHRIEKALWVDKSLAGMTPIATGLAANVDKLNTLVQTVTFQPAELANGASELLDEVGASKITGEEEAYSHIDLVDFQANVDGALQAYDLLEPALKATDPTLASTITARFTAVNDALKPYRTGTGPTDFKTYDAVPQADHKTLSDVVDALAEPLSKVAAQIVTS